MSFIALELFLWLELLLQSNVEGVFLENPVMQELLGDRLVLLLSFLEKRNVALVGDVDRQVKLVLHFAELVDFGLDEDLFLFLHLVDNLDVGKEDAEELFPERIHSIHLFLIMTLLLLFLRSEFVQLLADVFQLLPLEQPLVQLNHFLFDLFLGEQKVLVQLVVLLSAVV